MSEAKGAEKRSAAAFSLSFSGAVRLGKYRKMMRELSASAGRLYAEESDCAGAAKATFPKIYDAAISAIKTIEREAYFSRHRELFAAADEILEGIYAEENISERTVRESLTARAPAEGYSYIMLSLLPSALILKLAERYGENLGNAAEMYRICGMLGVISEMRLGDLPSSLCAASRIYYGEKADVYRYCSDETKRAYLRITAERAYLSGMGEASYAAEVAGEAAARGVHIGEILLKKDGFAGRVYFILLFAFTALFTLLFAVLAGGGSAFLLSLPLIIPIYEFVKELIRDFFVQSGQYLLPSISSEEKLRGHKVMVAVPTLLLGEEHDGGLITRLEDHYLTNSGENYIFALLCDLKAADKKSLPEDDGRIDYMKRRIDALNAKYGERFMLFLRERRFCEGENAYMGRERKRGAIIGLCRYLRGGESDIIAYGKADTHAVEYLLTLDEDTRLRPGAVSDMLGVMIHPMNKPVTDEKRRIVKKGYAIVAPRTDISLESSSETRFSELYFGIGGMDVYSGTSFDIYQNIFGSGSFCGKGMIDISAFCEVIPDFFPDGRILSHDLLEGNMLSCALYRGLSLSDEVPTDFISYYSRQERWIRGDTQALPYVLGSVRRRDGEKIKNPMSRLSRYKVADNAIRESAPLMLVLSVFLSALAGWKTAALAAVFASLYLIFPMLRTLALESGERGRIGGTLSVMLVRLLSSAHEAYVFARAFLTALYRMTISGRHLLEWQTASQSAAKKRGTAGLILSLLPSALIGAAAMLVPAPSAKFFGFLWLCFPLVIIAASKSLPEEERRSEKSKNTVRSYARDMWRFFATYVSEETNFLPPDNYQISPEERTAMRTSPTNIGLYLLSLLAARDFDFIDSEKLHFYAEKSGKSIEKLLSWRGHLYNWYDISTLSAIGEPFVSSVDSGNFVTALVAFCEGLREYASQEPRLLSDIALYEKFISRADFRALYCEAKRLFYIGYNAKNGTYGSSYYDTFMSEFRTTQYYATAAGFVPPESFFSLSRLAIGGGGRLGFASWSGTAFEYFMPALLLPHKKGSLSRAALEYAFRIQEENTVSKQAGGHTRRVFGISESGYYNFDSHMNYQYRAFGLEKLALDPACENGACVSPYSSFLMLEYGTDAVLHNLRELEALGMYGKYGFYEALDMDSTRVGGGYAVIRSYMAHHMGMSIVACANYCLDDIFVRRFMRSPRMRASRELLSERIPSVPKRAPVRIYREKVRPVRTDVYDEKSGERTEGFHCSRGIISPELALASNNKSRIVASSSGHMAFYDGRDAVALSDFETFSLSGGFRVVFLIDEKTYFAYPLGMGDVTAEKYEFASSCGAVEYRALFGEGEAIRSIGLRAEVLPNREIFRITAKINGEYKNASAMLYFEPVMAEERAYRAHKSFENLFIGSRYFEEEHILLFSRRKRSENRPFRFLALKVTRGKEAGCDTMRDAILPLAYSDADIAALASRECGNRVGACIVPACRMRAVFRRGEDTAEFIMGCSRNSDDLLFELSSYEKEKRGAGIGMREIARLQHFAAGNSREATALEKYILAGIFMPRVYRSEGQSAAIERLKKHPAKQSELWRFGISGDSPIVIAYIGDSGEEKLHNLETLLLLFKYMCIRGVRYDFAILHAERDLYNRPLEKRINELIGELGCRAFLGSENGIFTINDSLLTEEMRYFMRRICRVYFDCRIEPAIYARSEQRNIEISPDFGRSLISAVKTEPYPTAQNPEIKAVESIGTGIFHEDGYTFIKPHGGAPFTHVLAGRAFGTVVSENSLGFTYFSNSALRRLSPHSADNMREDRGERLCLRIFASAHDTGEYTDYDLAACAARVNYTFSDAQYYGTLLSYIDYTVKVGICGRFPVKRIELTLESRRSEPVYCMAYYAVTPDMGAPTGMIHYEKSESEISLSALADYGTGRFFVTVGVGGHIGTATYTDGIALASGERLSLGTEDIAAAAVRFALSHSESAVFYLSVNGAHRYLPRGVAQDDERGRVTLGSGDALFDLSVNKWIPYQIRASRLYARAAFYQVGGAWGFRDQLQDTLSLLAESPEEAKYQIIRCAAHQFPEGDVLHWWHSVRDFSLLDQGVRTRCSDDMLWLPYAVSEYITATGDRAILDVSVRYLSSVPLSPEEHERYERVPPSDEREDIYRHCLRAIRRLLDSIGTHGLAKIGDGDWNDGMNTVGSQGKGESVWLTQFAAIVLFRFADICDMRGEHETALFLRKKSRALHAAAVNCFEGDRFLRAYYDNGDKLGSRDCDECKTDALSQAFAAFDLYFLGGDEEERRRVSAAAKTSYDLLYSERYKLWRLLSPPFVSGRNSPGYIKGYLAGLRENGGQYTHAAVWAALGLLAAGEYAAGARVLFEINPTLRARDGFLRERYRIEPYVIAGDVYANPDHMGRGGWSWYTGAAGWYRTAIIKYLCGFRMSGAYFTLRPCLSEYFDAFSLDVSIGKTTYRVEVRRGERDMIVLDGERIYTDDIFAFRFALDGGSHKVKFSVARKTSAE